MKSLSILTALLCLGSLGCQQTSSGPFEQQTLLSPSGMVKIGFALNQNGTPYYKVWHKNELVIDSSQMGVFDFKGQPAMGEGFRVLATKRDSLNETWELPWGEQRKVLDHYNGFRVELQEADAPKRKLNIHLRAYDDGLAFRYEFPEQEGRDSIVFMDEHTHFALTSDPTCWWTPGDWDIYEHLYTKSKFSEIDAIAKRNHPSLGQTYIPENAVNTPVTLRTDKGLHLSFHEAALLDYAGMTLRVNKDKNRFESNLVGSDRLGLKAQCPLPFKTPWRSIQISEDAAGLLSSNLILNLNEPNKLGDVSYFKPMKYVGIWWEMHLGKSSWDMASGKHGATTANAKKHIDFAAANNMGGVLVEGWNTGWEHWIGFEDREGVFDFVTPYPDYDLEYLAQYAKDKGVQIIMHHETSAAPRTYEQQLESAFNLMNRLGIVSTKTGYVGKIIPKGEYHHGQWMVNHYQKVLETAAKHKIAINAHEPIKDTGLRRTFPNFISREGMRGQEFNAWSADGGNPPSHLPTVAFTRMLSGPFDFTPGVFNIKLKPYKEKNQVNTTLAQQLALYVVIYSPIQMACDLLENYEGQPAFQFIRDVGVDWDQTKVLAGAVGEYVAIARQERGTGDWFVGGITNEDARDLSLDFSFLDQTKKYEANIYRDGKNAHWDKNPRDIVIEKVQLPIGTPYLVHLAPGGGFAMSIKEVK
jgi:hypothetical protein